MEYSNTLDSQPTSALDMQHCAERFGQRIPFGDGAITDGTEISCGQDAPPLRHVHYRSRASDFPGEHWLQLRATKPVVSVFATL